MYVMFLPNSSYYLTNIFALDSGARKIQSGEYEVGAEKWGLLQEPWAILFSATSLDPYIG